MRKVQGEGIAMLEATNDLEVFRVRLGKALEFEFHEDYIGSLFSIKGPRDSTALLDIERALNMMEKVALDLRKKRGRPLMLIINNIHLFKDDADGQSLLEILQQRAEIWSANELITTIFTSDENWTFERLTPHATNMQTVTIRDVTRDDVIPALQQYRARFHNEGVPQSILEEVYAKIGGHLIFLTQVAKADDMLAACQHINRKEKAWLLAQCWILGDSMDDDVEDQQKFCVRIRASLGRSSILIAVRPLQWSSLVNLFGARQKSQNLVFPRSPYTRRVKLSQEQITHKASTASTLSTLTRKVWSGPIVWPCRMPFERYVPNQDSRRIFRQP
jgi:hypothetical protein